MIPDPAYLVFHLAQCGSWVHVATVLDQPHLSTPGGFGFLACHPSEKGGWTTQAVTNVIIEAVCHEPSIHPRRLGKKYVNFSSVHQLLRPSHISLYQRERAGITFSTERPTDSYPQTWQNFMLTSNVIMIPVRWNAPDIDRIVSNVRKTMYKVIAQWPYRGQTSLGKKSLKIACTG